MTLDSQNSESAWEVYVFLKLEQLTRKDPSAIDIAWDFSSSLSLLLYGICLYLYNKPELVVPRIRKWVWWLKKIEHVKMTPKTFLQI